jgi:hypothetical protein
VRRAAATEGGGHRKGREGGGKTPPRTTLLERRRKSRRVARVDVLSSLIRNVGDRTLANPQGYLGTTCEKRKPLWMTRRRNVCLNDLPEYSQGVPSVVE